VLGLGLLGAVLFVELGFRLLAPVLDLKVPAGGQLLPLARGAQKYVSHPYTVYRLNPKTPGVNSHGFRDREWAFAKAEGVTRVACLGASTTYGFHLRRAEQAYPHMLEQELEARTGREFEVMNFGVPAWTSAEILANYIFTVQDFEPDVVVIHLGINDVAPRQRRDFEPDYSHYRRSFSPDTFQPPNRALTQLSALYRFLYARTKVRTLQAGLEREDTPRGRVAKLDVASAEPFRRNLRSIVEHVLGRDGVVILVTLPHAPAEAERWPLKVQGIEQHNQILRELAQETGALLLDLAARTESFEPYFKDIVHVEEEGHALKARSIAERMIEGG